MQLPKFPSWSPLPVGGGGDVNPSPKKKQKNVYTVYKNVNIYINTHIIHVWHIFLHVVDFYGKCRYKYAMVWDIYTPTNLHTTLTNDGWKLTFLFWDGLFSRATLNFGSGTNGIAHHQFCPRNMHLTKLQGTLNDDTFQVYPTQALFIYPGKMCPQQVLSNAWQSTAPSTQVTHTAKSC